MSTLLSSAPGKYWFNSRRYQLYTKLWNEEKQGSELHHWRCKVLQVPSSPEWKSSQGEWMTWGHGTPHTHKHTCDIMHWDVQTGILELWWGWGLKTAAVSAVRPTAVTWASLKQINKSLDTWKDLKLTGQSFQDTERPSKVCKHPKYCVHSFKYLKYCPLLEMNTGIPVHVWFFVMQTQISWKGNKLWEEHNNIPVMLSAPPSPCPNV